MRILWWLMVVAMCSGIGERAPAQIEVRMQGGSQDDPGNAQQVIREDDASLSIEKLRERLGPDFREHSTSHFALLSDAPRSDVLEHAALLEQVHHQFTRICNRLQLTLGDVSRRMPCILFEKQSNFRSYASRYDDLTANWIGGYYAGEGNYAVFHLARDDEHLAELRDQLDDYQHKLEPLREAIRQARSQGDSERVRDLRMQLARHESQIKSERRRIEDFAEGSIKARTIHETIHLLSFNLGVQSRFRPAPFWLSEGLATNFETDRPDRAFGPDFDNTRQRDVFREVLTQNRLVAFSRFLVLTDARSVNDDEAEAAYAQAYAFVHWAFRFRREELGKCIAQYQGAMTVEEMQRWNRDAAAEHRRIFESAFGTIDELEKDWLRWERSQVR